MASFTISTIRVAPEQLYNAADDVIQKTSQAKTAFSEMRDIVRRTVYFWGGEAGDSHRAMFEEQVPQVETILQRFDAHAAHLKKIAANYINTETQVTTATEELPGDVIV